MSVGGQSPDAKRRRCRRSRATVVLPTAVVGECYHAAVVASGGLMTGDASGMEIVSNISFFSSALNDLEAEVDFTCK